MDKFCVLAIQSVYLLIVICRGGGLYDWFDVLFFFNVKFIFLLY